MKTLLTPLIFFSMFACLIFNIAETERDSPDSRDATEAPDRTVKATIRAEFSETGLILFDVSKISK
jgi:hypothetical protein